MITTAELLEQLISPEDRTSNVIVALIGDPNGNPVPLAITDVPTITRETGRQFLQSLMNLVREREVFSVSLAVCHPGGDDITEQDRLWAACVADVSSSLSHVYVVHLYRATSTGLVTIQP